MNAQTITKRPSINGLTVSDRKTSVFTSTCTEKVAHVVYTIRPTRPKAPWK